MTIRSFPSLGNNPKITAIPMILSLDCTSENHELNSPPDQNTDRIIQKKKNKNPVNGHHLDSGGGRNIFGFNPKVYPPSTSFKKSKNDKIPIRDMDKTYLLKTRQTMLMHSNNVKRLFRMYFLISITA